MAPGSTGSRPGRVDYAPGMSCRSATFVIAWRTLRTGHRAPIYSVPPGHHLIASKLARPDDDDSPTSRERPSSMNAHSREAEERTASLHERSGEEVQSSAMLESQEARVNRPDELYSEGPYGP